MVRGGTLRGQFVPCDRFDVSGRPAFRRIGEGVSDCA